MIRLENLSKTYPMGDGGRRVIYDNVSVTLPAKTTVGLLGKNGAGKSTLLRLLSGIEVPDSGRIVVEGDVSPPMGLKGGMVAALSGSSNAKFVCRILGDQPKVMKKRIEFIRHFSDLEDYFDQPVSKYSSGMRARLAFAMCIAFTHDWYLIDELFATSDVRFRARMFGTFKALRGRAGLLIVSHSLDVLRQWCDAGLHIHNGGADYYDRIDDAIEAYLRSQA